MTPLQVGMRILQHPTMQVTSALKRRFANDTNISQSYSGQVAQTFKFPFDRLDELATQEDANRSTVVSFLAKIGAPRWNDNGPVWTNVQTDNVLEFLTCFRQDEMATGISLPLIRSYIEHQNGIGELTKWTVAVVGLGSQGQDLGDADWGVPGGRKIWQISRTRLSSTSIGTLTSPSDESIGLSSDALERKDEIRERNTNIKEREAARMVRLPQEGLILIYPISRNSGQNLTRSNTRHPLFDNIGDPRVRDLIGLAVSFPNSEHPQSVQAYLEGTRGWRPVE